MVKRALPAAFASFCLAGASAAAPTSAPAAIIDSTASSRTDIRQAVTAALGTEVLIADDALTTSSLLIIERRSRRSIDGRVGSGRVVTPPEIFQLVLDDDQCILIHRRTGEAYPLENARCSAPPDTPRRDAHVPLSNQNPQSP